MPGPGSNPHGDPGPGGGADYVAPGIDALVAWGIPQAQAQEYINMAIQQGWSTAELWNYLSSNGVLEQYAPGSTAASTFSYSGGGGGFSFWDQMKEQYQQTARLYGINQVPDGLLRNLFEGHVSIQEFSDRLSAVQRITEFKPALQEFEQILQARGINSPNLSKDENVLKFMLGRAPKQFYALWDELNVGTAARQAGVHINQRLVRSIAKRLPGVQTEAEMQAGMQELANKIQTLLPLSKITKYGLSKKQLVTLQFGGPNQQKIADKVRRILAQEEGFQGDRAIAPSRAIGAREEASQAPSF